MKWEGDKAVVVQIEAVWEENQLFFKVDNVVLKGALTRMDRFEISKSFVERLTEDFKRELQKAFKNAAFETGQIMAPGVKTYLR